MLSLCRETTCAPGEPERAGVATSGEKTCIELRFRVGCRIVGNWLGRCIRSGSRVVDRSATFGGTLLTLLTLFVLLLLTRGDVNLIFGADVPKVVKLALCVIMFLIKLLSFRCIISVLIRLVCFGRRVSVDAVNSFLS